MLKLYNKVLNNLLETIKAIMQWLGWCFLEWKSSKGNNILNERIAKKKNEEILIHLCTMQLRTSTLDQQFLLGELAPQPINSFIRRTSSADQVLRGSQSFFLLEQLPLQATNLLLQSSNPFSPLLCLIHLRPLLGRCGSGRPYSLGGVRHLHMEMLVERSATTSSTTVVCLHFW